MADDQGPKIASIDELVNELTKKNPPSAGGPNPQTPPSGGTAPFSPPKSVLPILPPTEMQNRGSSISQPRQGGGEIGTQPEIPKPKFTPPPSVGAPVPPRPAPSAPSLSTSPRSPQPPVKEYQSSIRTMKEDIVNLKQGQKTSGVDISRKVGPPPAPATPPVGQTPGPSQQFKMPSVSLGQTQKAPSLPQAKAPTPPSVRGPAPAPQKTQIYAPPSSARGFSGGRKSLFMIIAGAAVVFGILYWFLILRTPTPETVVEIPTPTPTPTVTETPVVTLAELFGGLEIIISVDPNNVADSFARSAEAIVMEGGNFGRITLKDAQGMDFPWSGLVNMPQQVRDSLGGEALLVAYGQKEFFGPTGQIDPAIQTKPRVAMIFEVKDQSAALQAATVWETTLTGALSKIFGLVQSNQPNPNFLDNTYQGLTVRYRNFPWPDKSIDYGIISAANGKTYLVIAGSRESMFASIDQLKGQ